jgi:GrpB-like predicted nucleotidyltransferase (UPF0157 family)
MLTKADINWLEHLSNSRRIKIVPYDPDVQNIFNAQRNEILNILGQQTIVLHGGSSGLGISGQDEIDIFIPVSRALFDKTVKKLTVAYGLPGSYYAQERVRFNRYVKRKKIEVFVVNKSSVRWKRSVAFENYLRTHSVALKAYNKLKEEANGKGVKDYYRLKLEFANEVIAKAFDNQ